MSGILYLTPVVLGDVNPSLSIPAALPSLLNKLKYFIVEDPKGARRALRQSGFTADFETVEMQVLNEHTSVNDLGEFLKPLRNGESVALLSDAGCPAIADPGAALIQMAHKEGIEVKPLTGPSSILLALMGSGFNGQHFTFQGYLPKDRAERQKKIIAMERSANNGITQIFIETPYRNNKLLEELIFSLDKNTMLCLACDLTLQTEEIICCSIKEWNNKKPDFDKRPAVFLIGK